ncbi:MAG: hypothetical protein WBB45_18670 [Cyclobacteriaceae bacterium]
MKKAQLLFHVISYLQYPLMLAGLYYILLPYFNNFDGLFESYNRMLMFSGLAITFSTLQDTTKVQNKLSLRIYRNPKLARYFLASLLIITVLSISAGLAGFLGLHDSKLKELSIGLIVFGVGLLSMLKTVMELAAYHGEQSRKDRLTEPSH